MSHKETVRAVITKIVFVIMLLVLSCYHPAASNDYTITLTIYTHGTHKLWTWSLDTDSILIIKHSTNNEPDKIILSRKLTAAEKENLQATIKTIPLASLKSAYINRQVQGEIHREFDIRIGSERKKITVYFMEVEPLEKINTVMRSFAEFNY
ncbi:MAG TPA: hypothetical protein PK253_04700 [Spirochaetota bacterium]|nr:hypothetical protein [Spirochaetota bacterium]